MFSLGTIIRRLILVLACGALVLPGCAGEEEAFGKRFPVSGNVTYNGQPLEKGTISFVPDGKGAGASGTVEKGVYKLSTGGEADGALPGKYKVTVMAKEDSEEKAKAEFATAVRYKLPIITVVVNNGIYGTIRMHQEREYPGRVSATDLTNPDFAALAVAYGGHGETVEKTEDFAPAFLRARASGKPAIIEVKLDPEAITPTRTLSDIRSGK